MSERYEREIDALTDHFAEDLADMRPVVVTAGQYAVGVDSLGGEFKEMTRLASRHWIQDRGYELSYNQMCIAFFRAARRVGKLTVTP